MQSGMGYVNGGLPPRSQNGGGGSDVECGHERSGSVGEDVCDEIGTHGGLRESDAVLRLGVGTRNGR